MSYTQGQKVRITREKDTISPPARVGEICEVYRNEGFGCYILKNPNEERAFGGRLFAAKEDEFQAVEGEGAEK